ncbi:MAG: glycoside hydrolase family 172 protein [Bacteroidota bacterium]
MKARSLPLLIVGVLALVTMQACKTAPGDKTGVTSIGGSQDEVYLMPEGVTTRWASFENINAEKGEGGKAGNGAKGYPYYVMQPGESVEILNIEGAGIIDRIWMTVDDLFHIPEEHRSIRIEMFWDNSEEPAVSAPLEDFFNQVFGNITAFENALFASPEGRSMVSIVKMPFRTAARVVITNESTKRTHRVFYDINMTLHDELPGEALYFHAYWRRERATTPGTDFEIMPRIEAKGRFFGCNMGIINFHQYRGWWGEGEVKVYMDGDTKYPTLAGTGTEDYVSTGWGQGAYHNMYWGSSLIDDEQGLYAFYRFHIPDPIWFQKDIRVTIQQMGGHSKGEVKAMMAEGKPAIPVCHIDSLKVQHNFSDGETSFEDDSNSDATWTNYYRQDDVCATAYLYLDTPNGVAERVPSFEERR